MTAPTALPLPVHDALRRVQLRLLAAGLAVCVPWALLAIALQWALRSDLIAASAHARIASTVAFAIAALALAATAGFGQRHGRGWLVRALDAQRPDMENSSDLLLSPSARTAMQELQRTRLLARLAAQRADLQPLVSWRRLWQAATVSWLLASATGVLVLRVPTAAPVRSAVAARASSDVARPPVLRESRLRITPPRYTGQPTRLSRSLSASAPQGATLDWEITVAPNPRAVALRFLDGSSLPLRHDGDTWRGSRVLAASVLYRVQIDGRDAGPATPWRLQAVVDQPPQVRVLSPERSLTVGPPGLRAWALEFLANDDHGVAATATLHLTLAQGSGENIRFSERVLTLPGTGPARARRFRHRVDPLALGLAAGDDLVAWLAVRDLRQPVPHDARSASVILRLATPDADDGGGIEGVVSRVMPAYFRSQRQIIIDAEALLKQKRSVDADNFVKRSDAIGVDQRLLRLRYGQFLGEESEGAPRLPTADADPEPDHDPAATTDVHDHPHPPAPASPDAAALGTPRDLLGEFGHTHDIAEAATLLDPQTRELLRQALGQMWQSELQLRQGEPAAALPHAHKALAFIKRVQQADRIYLARVGPDLPPIDESRRMTGKRDGLASRPDPLPPLPPRAANVDPLVSLWQSLVAGRPVRDAALPAGGDSLLPLAAAVDGLQREPGCTPCRADAIRLAWPLLPRPVAGIPRRAPPDQMGERYLDRLDHLGPPTAQEPRP